MQLKPRWILLLASVVATVLYWPGLHGPFIMDDEWNLHSLHLWLAGQASLNEVLLPHPSLVFSRPVSMASFALSAWLLGADTFSFKLGNLVVHLACGWMGWAVLRRALARDACLRPQAELLATLAALFWLLHPLQVSTVLYAVQRMAQLSTFFTLAAVYFYLVGRQQLIDSRLRASRLNLFLGFPAMLILGLLSKQNAAVAPALCFVLELAYFSRTAWSDRSTGLFFALFLWLPALAVAGLLALAPERLLSGYSEWDFTVWERLLTQPRALLDYLSMLIFPRGPLMGLYTDDFTVSHSLLSPPSTLMALLALGTISTAAVAFRKRAPSVFAGWFFFLVAHSVESGFLPLEMYYEHRNYLPSFGALLATLGLLALAPSFQTNTISPRNLALVAATGFTLILCVGTLGRVLVWQDMGNIVQLGVKAHPNSMRARFDLAAWALQRKDYATAEGSMRAMAESGNPRFRQLGNLSMVTVNCMRGVDQGNLQMMQLAVDEKLPRLTTYEAQAFRRLSGVIRMSGCGILDVATAAEYLSRILDAANAQSDTSQPKWFSRSIVAEMYAHVGDWKPAQHQAELAWKGSGHDARTGALLASIYIRNGELRAARVILKELTSIIKPYDKGGQSTLLALQGMLKDASKN